MIMQKPVYQLVRKLINPTHRPMTHEQVQLVLSKMAGTYCRYKNYGLASGHLECAGVAYQLLQAAPSCDEPPKECVHRALQLELESCSSRCGSTCTGACKVIAFVLDAAGSASFFYGERHDVLDYAQPDRNFSDLYIWDEPRARSMADIRALVTKWLPAGLAMHKIPLNIPGHQLFLYRRLKIFSDYLRWQLQRHVYAGRLQFKFELRMKDGERVIGAPHTADWQQRMEATFPHGLAASEAVIGFATAFDKVQLIQHAQGQEAYPVYVFAECLPLERGRYACTPIII